MKNNELNSYASKVLGKKVEDFHGLKNKYKHKVLWYWLSQHPICCKDDFFLEFGIELEFQPMMECYACEQESIDTLGIKTNGHCYCPIVWNDGRCTSHSSEYLEWENAKSLEDRSKIAFKIANLEWIDR